MPTADRYPPTDVGVMMVIVPVGVPAVGLVVIFFDDDRSRRGLLNDDRRTGRRSLQRLDDARADAVVL